MRPNVNRKFQNDQIGELNEPLYYRVSTIKLKVATEHELHDGLRSYLSKNSWKRRGSLLQVHDPPCLFFVANAKIFESRLARRAPRGPALSSFCPKQNQHGVHGCHWCGMIVVYLHKRVDEEPYFILYETLWPFLFGMQLLEWRQKIWLKCWWPIRIIKG